MIKTKTIVFLDILVHLIILPSALQTEFQLKSSWKTVIFMLQYQHSHFPPSPLGNVWVELCPCLKFIWWSTNLQHLRMWPCSEIGRIFADVINTVKPGHTSIGWASDPIWLYPYEKGKCGLRRTPKVNTLCRWRQRWALCFYTAREVKRCQSPEAR